MGRFRIFGLNAFCFRIGPLSAIARPLPGNVFLFISLEIRQFCFDRSYDTGPVAWCLLAVEGNG